jgi:hypothetical protein
MKRSIGLGAALLAIYPFTLAVGNSQSPCAAHPAKPGWKVFVDARNKFCFEYPPKYRAAPPVAAPGTSLGLASRFLARLTTKPTPRLGAGDDDVTVAEIEVFAYSEPFHPESLAKFAPTGMEDSPAKRIHEPYEDFYYYGAGGGGVNYPDVYYFGMSGRMFSIEFDGPYRYDKTPDEVTKRIEPQVLASFRRF